MGEAGAPVKGDSRKTVALLRKSAAYPATGLRILKNIVDKETVDIQDLNNLFVVFAAQYKLFQTEQTMAMVEGTGVSKDCVNMFRFLSKNPAFTASDTVAFENATRISVAASMEKCAERGYGGQFRGRGRINSRFGRSGRGYRDHNSSQNSERFGDKFASSVENSSTKL